MEFVSIQNEPALVLHHCLYSLILPNCSEEVVGIVKVLQLLLCTFALRHGYPFDSCVSMLNTCSIAKYLQEKVT